MAKEIFNNVYYDIESLSEVFSLATYNEKTNHLEIYYLLDEKMTDLKYDDAVTQAKIQFAQTHNIDLQKTRLDKIVLPENMMPDKSLYEFKNRDFTDDEMHFITQMIRIKNPIFNGTVSYHNLYNVEEVVKLAKDFGCDCEYLPDNFRFPMICDVDPKYDENTCPYYLGYNSNNYDTTMIALFFQEVFAGIGKTISVGSKINGTFIPTTPSKMRIYNDELFDPHFKGNMTERLKWTYCGEPAPHQKHGFDYIQIGAAWLHDEGWNTENPAFYIRRNMINTGRHIDVALLNEKQVKVGLKRLLGMSGYQILESDTDLSSNGTNHKMIFHELAALLAYNTSDVVNLKNLFHDKNYLATFKLKKQMLLDYPELVFDQIVEPYTETAKQSQRVWDPNKGEYVTKMVDVQVKKTRKLYKPDKRIEKMKRNRHTINSTSARLAASCLCPYGNLKDDAVVSFMYPSEKKSKELGIPRLNILDETEKFIEERMRPKVHNQEGMDIINGLNEMIRMYRNIEGKDFNSSHGEDDPYAEIYNLKSFAEKINVPYMDENGEASDCYVTFSTGGIHGAQYNKERYMADVADFNRRMDVVNRVIQQYGSASNLLIYYDEKGKARKRKTFTLDGDPNEYVVGDYIPSTTTIKVAQAGNAKFKREYEAAKPPQLFPENNKGIRSLSKKYTITSFGNSNHEDFTSYYPSMLINMSAFWNDGLGYDRYEEIFGNKEKFGKLMKDKSIPEDQRAIYGVMRNGTKLILNSASGAADVEYNTPIRMNNRIIAMRIIGQLFTWRIGQAQSLEGARVPSTNTDGLYTFFDEELNNKTLEREAKAIHVGIEPEPIFIVSKDANNRWEGEVKAHTGNTFEDVKIIAASGGTLACMDGPNTAKSLAHPAILDWGLAEFLKWKALMGKMDGFDMNAGKALLEMSSAVFTDKVHLLRMFQNVVASNPNNGTYNFASKTPLVINNGVGLNENVIEPIAMQHYSRIFYVDPNKVPAEHKDDIVYIAAAYIREDKNDASPLAIKVIRDLNNNAEVLLKGKAKLKKLNGIETTTPCIICNEDLSVTDKIDYSWLDLDYYNVQLKSVYAKNWQNYIVGEEIVEDDDDDSAGDDFV